MLTFSPHVPNINFGKKFILLVRAKCILLRGIYLQHCQTSKTEHFHEIVESFEYLSIFVKHPSWILDRFLNEPLLLRLISAWGRN